MKRLRESPDTSLQSKKKPSLQTTPEIKVLTKSKVTTMPVETPAGKGGKSKDNGKTSAKGKPKEKDLKSKENKNDESKIAKSPNNRQSMENATQLSTTKQLKGDGAKKSLVRNKNSNSNSSSSNNRDYNMLVPLQEILDLQIKLLFFRN